MKIDLILSKPNKKIIEGEITFKKKYTKNKIFIINILTPLESPYVVDAKAIIVETGGLLGHSAIFSRELGIGCVKVENATKKYKEGDKVKIYFEKGEIEKL